MSARADHQRYRGVITNATRHGETVVAYDHHGVAAAAELVYGEHGPEELPSGDGGDALSGAVRGCAVRLFERTTDRRSRHRDRWRRAVYARHRWPELDQLPAVSHGGV